MGKHFCRLLTILILSILVGACRAGTSERVSLAGPILLWHPQLEEGEEVFDELVAKFSIIYPEVTIIRTALPFDELHEKFLDDTQLGFGPDLLIGDSRWVAGFAEAGLIEDLSSQDDIDTSIYFSKAVNTLRYTPTDDPQEGLYGLPFGLNTLVLYYNKNLVDVPPATLPALLEQAAGGRKVALDTRFYGAFWGIQAFGGQLLDEQGRVVLDQGGFANWLGWLKNAQNEPNLILNDNDNALLNLFLNGEAAYYVGESILLPSLKRVLGQETVGVARLPAGPNNNPAGPFLVSHALMLNTASSPAQQERALRLAQFLTNVEQQTTLTLQVGLVPANSQVRVDPRVSPTVAEIIAQTKTAVPALNLPQVFAATGYGDDIYVKALAGELDLNAAAIELTKRVNLESGFDGGEIAVQLSCEQAVTIQVWHSWPEPDAASLNQIAANFQRLCPHISINLPPPSSSDQEQLFERYREAAAQDEGPDLLIADNRWLARLAAAGLLSDLTHLVRPEFLQRYVPGAQETMRFKGKLYGLPLSMESMALYYNSELVTDPARDLDDLLNQATPERWVILPFDFYTAYWGVPAFGGRMFDAEDRLALHEGGFAQWLSWLQAAQGQPGIVLSNDPEQALALFAQQKAVYLAGEKWMLTWLQAELGEKVGVVPLPAGPKGESGPFLVVEGLLLNPASAPAESAAAFEFAQYLTNLKSQTILMQQASRVPANVNVDTTAAPAIGGFLEQARTAFVPPNDLAEQVFAIMAQGQAVYAAVLEEGQNPAEAVNNFANLVNAATSSDGQ